MDSLSIKQNGLSLTEPYFSHRVFLLRKEIYDHLIMRDGAAQSKTRIIWEQPGRVAHIQSVNFFPCSIFIVSYALLHITYATGVIPSVLLHAQ